jgi:hypothetical protein
MHVVVFLLPAFYIDLLALANLVLSKLASFLAYCFSFTYFAKTAYLWLVLPNPSTNR